MKVIVKLDLDFPRENKALKNYKFFI